jgi:hypothetical protein
MNPQAPHLTNTLASKTRARTGAEVAGEKAFENKYPPNQNNLECSAR